MLGREGFRAFVNQVQFAARARGSARCARSATTSGATYVDQDGGVHASRAPAWQPRRSEIKPAACLGGVRRAPAQAGHPGALHQRRAQYAGGFMRRMQAGRPLTPNRRLAAGQELCFCCKQRPGRRAPSARRRPASACHRRGGATHHGPRASRSRRAIASRATQHQRAQEHGVAVNTIHRGKAGDGYTKNRGWWGWRGHRLRAGGDAARRLGNVDQKAREGIAAGAQARARWPRSMAPSTRRISFDGVEFRFNPKREHLFRDALDPRAQSAPTK